MASVFTGMENVIFWSDDEKTLYKSSFDWKKNVEDSIKDGLVITATTTGIFYVLKAEYST